MAKPVSLFREKAAGNLYTIRVPIVNLSFLSGHYGGGIFILDSASVVIIHSLDNLSQPPVIFIYFVFCACLIGLLCI